MSSYTLNKADGVGKLKPNDAELKLHRGVTVVSMTNIRHTHTHTHAHQ